MSLYQFLASNRPLKDRLNPNIEFLSIEEAENRGVQLPNWYQKDMRIDRQGKIVLFCSSEECLHELEIREDNDSIQAKNYSNKKCFSSISWRFTESRGQELIDYIAEHLESASEIELWNTWLDEQEVPIMKKCHIATLKVSDLEEVFGQCSYEKPHCLIVKR